MPIKPLQDYTAADMTIPEMRDDAKAQAVGQIVALNDAAQRHMQGMRSSLSAYDNLRQHPAYALLSQEHRDREIAAAHAIFADLTSLRDDAHATLLALDPDAEV